MCRPAYTSPGSLCDIHSQIQCIRVTCSLPTYLCHLPFSLYSAGISSDRHWRLYMASCQLQVLVKPDPAWCPDPYCDEGYILSPATEGPCIEPDMAPAWPVARKRSGGQPVDRFKLRLGLELEPRDNQGLLVLGIKPEPLAP